MNIRNHFSSLCDNGGIPTKRFWESVKPVLSDKGSHGNENYTFLENGKLIEDHRESSEIFNDHYINDIENITGKNGRDYILTVQAESRDLLGFYCRASIAYNIMLLTFILTLSFSSPILDENAVSVRNDTCTATSSQLLHVRQLLLNCSIKKAQVNKSKSFSNFAFKTVL